MKIFIRRMHRRVSYWVLLLARKLLIEKYEKEELDFIIDQMKSFSVKFENGRSIYVRR